jgi:hypothetical protein
MTETNKSDIDTLLPDQEITVHPVDPESGKRLPEEVVAVRPLLFTQWGKAAKILKPLASDVAASGILRATENGMVIAADWAFRLPELLADGGEAVFEFVAFALRKPRPWMDTLQGDDGVALTKLVLEVNSDFFAKRIAPLLGLAVQADQSPAAGAPSSSD